MVSEPAFVAILIANLKPGCIILRSAQTYFPLELHHVFTVRHTHIAKPNSSIKRCGSCVGLVHANGHSTQSPLCFGRLPGPAHGLLEQGGSNSPSSSVRQSEDAIYFPKRSVIDFIFSLDDSD